MYEEGIGNIEAYLCLFICLYLFNVYLDERTYRGEWKHCVVSSDWGPNRIHLVSLLYSLECVIEVEFLAENRSSLFRCPLYDAKSVGNGKVECGWMDG